MRLAVTGTTALGSSTEHDAGTRSPGTLLGARGAWWSGACMPACMPGQCACRAMTPTMTAAAQRAAGGNPVPTTPLHPTPPHPTPHPTPTHAMPRHLPPLRPFTRS